VHRKDYNPGGGGERRIFQFSFKKFRHSSQIISDSTSTPNVEAARSSETSVCNHHPTRRNNAGNHEFQLLRHENLKYRLECVESKAVNKFGVGSPLCHTVSVG